MNLADPFAILALAAIIIAIILARHLPSWREGHVNAAIAAISTVLLFAILRGIPGTGVTQ